MHDKKTLRSHYTAVSFCCSRTTSGFFPPPLALLQRSVARSDAIPRGSPQHQHRFGVPLSGRDPQRPDGLIRPHHILSEPRHLRRLIGIGHIAIPRFRSPTLSRAPRIISGLEDILL